MWFWQASAGPDHFLVSDDIFHLASGWHDHGGATVPWWPDKSQAIEDDKLLIRFVEEYMKRA